VFVFLWKYSCDGFLLYIESVYISICIDKFQQQNSKVGPYIFLFANSRDFETVVKV